MQERHTNRQQYFEEQAATTAKYYIPYIESVIHCKPSRVLEVGCGEGGNLLPFARMGCEVVGVDMCATRIDQAIEFFESHQQKGTFIASDIFKLTQLQQSFDLILVHDVIEHIYEKEAFLSGLKEYLSTDGCLFVGFPAWQMPFGGHQQIASGKFVSHLPFIHLLPPSLYRRFLKMCGEKEITIRELLSIQSTKCSIERFERAIKSSNYTIVSRQLYFINPNYETKFGLKPRKLCKTISQIPHLRNFFSTSCFYVIKPLV